MRDCQERAPTSGDHRGLRRLGRRQVQLIIQMATAELEKDEAIVVLSFNSFNGWLFEEYEDAKTVSLEGLVETWEPNTVQCPDT